MTSNLGKKKLDITDKEQRKKKIEIANIAREVGKSKMYTTILNKGLANSAGIIRGGIFSALIKLKNLGLVKFTSEYFQGKHLPQLTDKGRAVLVIINQPQLDAKR